MSVELVVGAQWGDEGKGKMVDILAAGADLVVRFAGGANAGHTIVTGGRTFKFHLLPSGAVRPGKVVALGNGMVVDPEQLRKELAALEASGCDTSGVMISDRAHVILPYHKVLDALEETCKAAVSGKGAMVGTTGRGIGPAYTDKVRRTGIRFCDLKGDDPALLRARLEAVSRYLSGIAGHLWENSLPEDRPDREGVEASLDVDALVDLCAGYGMEFGGRMTDVSLLVDGTRREGGRILLEGAQGTMLDIDHGTYPYVTSSNCTAGGACAGAGIGPRHMDDILGVVKAYTTRVGAGPMVTELEGDVGAHMQEAGNEFGATTSRPRRCGWLDMVVVRRAVRLNSLDGLLVTKVDVLGDLETLRVCRAYTSGGAGLEDFPADLEALAGCSAVYDEMPGWSSDGVRGVLEGMRGRGDDELGTPGDFAGLPEALRSYIQYIADGAGVPVVMVSVGPDRLETFDLRGDPITPTTQDGR